MMSDGDRSERRDTPGADQRLDAALVRGIAWTGGMKWATQLVSWASMIIVARLLTPQDFGVVGAATVFIGLVTLINELGLSGVLVQQRHLSREQIAQIGGVSIAAGVVLAGVTCLLALPLAGFFRNPAVAGILAVMSLQFIASGAQVVPRAMLQRDLGFRQLASIDGLQAVVAMGFTLALAFLGYGYWSLVLSNVVTMIIVTFVLAVRFPHPIAWPSDFRRIQGAMRMGWQIVVSRIAWYGYTNADFTVVGRMLGSGMLGQYTLGWNVACIPVARISALVGQVLPGVLSQVQHDVAALRRYVLHVSSGLALITLPLSIGAALTGDDLVQVVLGPTWAPASVPLRLLSLYAGLRSLCPILSNVLVATGRARLEMMISLWGLIILPPLFVLGTRWGTTGVAGAWIIGYPLVALPLFRVVFKQLEIRVTDYIRALGPVLTGCAAMAVVILGLGALTREMAAPVRLAAEVLCGAGVYVAIALLPQRGRVKEAVGLLRGVTP